METGVYSVTVSNNCGQNEASIQLTSIDCNNLGLPNIFSPNGDGINDFFAPQGLDPSLSINQFQVFDRWGNLVYQNNGEGNGDSFAGWNGTGSGGRLAPVGTYIYLLIVSHPEGRVIQQSGDITLIR